MHLSKSTDERGDALQDILSPTSGNGSPVEGAPDDLTERLAVYDLSA